MSVDPSAGPAYRPPVDRLPRSPDFAGDDYDAPVNPDGSEIGPLVMTPEGEQWCQENVIDKGRYINWGTREIFDPETGEIFGTVPKSLPRMT
jgi:hypothetical protein